MARVLIEQVTCDKCGEIKRYEKLNNLSAVARMEPLTEWLINLDWYVETSGFKTIDLCPLCANRTYGLHKKRLEQKRKNA